MLRTGFFYIVFLISLVVTGMLLPVWHVLNLSGFKNAAHSLGHYTSLLWARFLLKVAGVKVTVKGLENVLPDETLLFVSNHQSNFDIPVLLGYINKPKGFLAKIELAKIPVMNSWMRKMGCVFINRTNLRQSVKAIQICAGVIKSGQSMVIFPEGTRSKSPKMGEFKKGSLRLVEKTGAPIIPVSISGTYKIMEANNNLIRPAQVKVTISEPIYLDKLSLEERDNIDIIIRNSIIKHLP